MSGKIIYKSPVERNCAFGLLKLDKVFLPILFFPAAALVFGCQRFSASQFAPTA